MVKARIISWDLETSNLNANFGFVLCAGYKIYGEKKIYIPKISDYKLYEKDPTNDKELVKDFASRINDADIWIGHYMDRFDRPYLNSRLLFHGLPTLPRIPVIDTWRVSKYQLKLNSNRLQTVVEFLQLEDKTAVKGPHWVKAMAGNKQSLKYIVDHCLVPDHKVLTADLKWKSLGDLIEEEELIGFTDKQKGFGRYYSPSKVESVTFKKTECLRVILGNGEEFICTPDHLWLIGRYGFGEMRWRQTRNLRTRRASKHGTAHHYEPMGSSKLYTKITKLFPNFSEINTKEAGYLQGIIDGEGYVTPRGYIAFSQRSGEILNKSMDIVKELGYKFGLKLVTSKATGGLGKGDCMTVRLYGPLPRRLAFIGQIRPVKMNKLDINSFGRMERRESDEVTWVEYIEPAGIKEVAVVNTSSRTFICEGYPMHNCRQDVLVLEQAYERLRPLIPNHPNVNIITKKTDNCPVCSSSKIQSRGYSVARTTRKRRYQCIDCGSWSTGRPEKIPGIEIR